MATCDSCRQEMSDSVGCTLVRYDGEAMDRLPYDGLTGASCRDCGCPEGALHHPGCCVERCPECGGQAITCDHAEAAITHQATARGIPAPVSDGYMLVGSGAVAHHSESVVLGRGGTGTGSVGVVVTGCSHVCCWNVTNRMHTHATVNVEECPGCATLRDWMQANDKPLPEPHEHKLPRLLGRIARGLRRGSVLTCDRCGTRFVWHPRTRFIGREWHAIPHSDSWHDTPRVEVRL